MTQRSGTTAHFTGEDTEAQRRHVTAGRGQSWGWSRARCNSNTRPPGRTACVCFLSPNVGFLMPVPTYTHSFHLVEALGASLAPPSPLPGARRPPPARASMLISGVCNLYAALTCPGRQWEACLRRAPH